MAGRLKRKTRITINLFETLNNNRLKTGGTVTAYIYPGGMQIENTATIPASPSTVSLQFSGRGSMGRTAAVGIVRVEDSDEGKWVRQDVAGQLLIYSGLVEEQNTPGRFAATINDVVGAGLSVQPGDRVVSLGLATLYEDESDEADTISQVSGIDVPTHGSIEFYCEYDSVDVYLVGNDIEDGWYAFNVPCGDSSIGALTLVAETLSADGAGDIFVDARTGLIIVDSAVNPITQILHGNEHRLLVLLPIVNGVTLQTSTSTTLDGHIYDPSGGTIVLDAYVPILLVSKVGQSAANHFWTILGTPNVNDFSLDELVDVDAASPTVGWPLVWDGANWISTGDMGSLTVPLVQVYAEHDQFRLTNGSHFAAFDASGLSSNRSFIFPDMSGTFLLNAGNQTISGRKDFVDGANGFRLYNSANPSRIAQFDLSGLSATAWTYAFPNKSGTFALLDDAKQTLADLLDTDLTTVPPALNDLLQFDGTDWVNTRIIGSLAAPLAELNVDAAVLYVKSGAGNFRHAIDNASGKNESTYLPSQDAGFVGFQVLKSTANHAEVVRCTFPFTATTGLFNILSTNVNRYMIFRVPDTLLASFTQAFTHLQFEWLFDAAAVTAGAGATLAIYKGVGLPAGLAIPPAATKISADITVPAAGVTNVTGGQVNPGAAVTMNPGDFVFLSLSGAGAFPGVSGVLNLALSWRPTPNFV